MRITIAGMFVCLVALLTLTAAGAAPGRLEGVILDESGAGVPGVVVSLAGSRAVPRTSTTDERGRFSFPHLPVGQYLLTARVPGYADVSRRVRVSAIRTANVRIQLEAADAQEQVAVGEMVGTPPPAAASESRDGDLKRRANRPSGMLASPAKGAVADSRWRVPYGRLRMNTEAYDRVHDNRFVRVENEPLSTFSVDVDTASYSNVRRFLNEGRFPPPDAVRIEELINYFRYEYAAPRGETPFGVTTEIANCPWNRDNVLVLVGLAGRDIDVREAPARNLVFLLDVSGSMDEPDKMPLLKGSMRLLVDRLTARDRVGIVVYAGATGVALESTPGDRKARIHAVLASLQPEGTTNGGAGIRAAYRMARDNFIKGGVNRVILATDGDFNVGVTSQGDLLRLIERERESGVSLSVLGFGTGNLKDSTMEKLADSGNGNYSYIDSLHEGRKVLVSEAGGTLVTIAKDVKLQVEFNPRAVSEYRLIGYENRLLEATDFNDDRKDAGEIGAGHTVTALYEVVRFGKGNATGRAVDPLKYQRDRAVSASNEAELMNLKLRYKEPDGGSSRLIEVPVANRPGSIGQNIGFASAVAEFGMLLRDAPDRGSSSFGHVLSLARRFRGDDPHGYRAEFIRLVELAESLSPEMSTSKQH